MTVLDRAVGRYWSLELTYTKETALGFQKGNQSHLVNNKAHVGYLATSNESSCLPGTSDMHLCVG